MWVLEKFIREVGHKHKEKPRISRLLTNSWKKLAREEVKTCRLQLSLIRWTSDCDFFANRVPMCQTLEKTLISSRRTWRTYLYPNSGTAISYEREGWDIFSVRKTRRVGYPFASRWKMEVLRTRQSYQSESVEEKSGSVRWIQAELGYGAADPGRSDRVLTYLTYTDLRWTVDLHSRTTQGPPFIVTERGQIDRTSSSLLIQLHHSSTPSESRDSSKGPRCWNINIRAGTLITMAVTSLLINTPRSFLLTHPGANIRWLGWSMQAWAVRDIRRGDELTSLLRKKTRRASTVRACIRVS